MGFRGIMLFGWLMCLCVSSVHALASDLWVDSSQASDGDGSFGNPYKRISTAMDNATSGDTIKVIKGTYDYNVGDNGESFPITMKHQVKIVGQGATVNDYPRVGGDVDNSSIEALFLAEQLTSGTRSGIEIKNLYFVGEETEDENAPSAVRFGVRNGGVLANCSFSGNHCERSLMDHSSDPPRATVLVDVGEGLATVTIFRNTIVASERGAIEQRLNTNASSSTNTAFVDVTITNNTVLIEGTDTAEFGIKVGGVGEAWTADTCEFTVRDNVVDSTGVTGSGGIGIGIDAEVYPQGDATMTFVHGHTFIVSNEVTGCLGSGIRLRSSQEDGFAHLSCWDLARNRVHHNGGAGLEVDWGSASSEVGGGYLNFESDSNMLVDNEYGVHLHSGQGPDAMSTGSLLNDTIAMNRDVGLRIDDLVLGTLARVINCIVYFNNAGNDQSSPTLANLTSVDIEYCDWQGMWPLPNNNIASDPYFVDEDSGDYHLTASSPCIDAGDDTPSTLDIGEVDFEGDDRQIDAVAGGLVVDIGADEYVPEQ